MKRSTYNPPEDEFLGIPEPMPVTEVERGNLWRAIRWGVPVSLALWALALGLGALIVAVSR